MKHLVQFDFDASFIFTVMYDAPVDLSDEIEDAVSSYIENNEDEDYDYEDLVTDVMNSFTEITGWEEVDCKVIRV